MAKPEYASLTDRIGGQRTIVLVVVCGLLLIFMVASEVVPSLGLGGSPPSDFIQFRVGGEQVEVSYQQYQLQMADWQRFHRGLAQAEGRFDTGLSQEFFYRDVMLEGLAHEAGVEISDRTLVDYVHSRPYFQDRDGNFDADVFDINRESLFGDMSIRGYEGAARRHLAVDHYRRLYATTFLLVTDAEAYDRWKGDHPKVAVSYAWQPVAPLRAELSADDVTDADLEQHWADPTVQARHKLPPRFAFKALSLRIDDVSDAAFEAARETWKDIDGLAPTDDEIYEFYNQSREYEFDPTDLTEEERLALVAENPGWREAILGPAPEDEPSVDGSTDPGAPEEEALPGGDAVVRKPEDLDPAEIPQSARARFVKYWRHRLTKEVWLRNVVERIIADARESGRPLAEVAGEWERPDLEFPIIDQQEPIDQYAVEEIEGLGGANNPTRYVLSGSTPEREGQIHEEVLDRTALRSEFDRRGWVALQIEKVLPSEVPPLADVREAIASEVLDRKAKDQARQRLEVLRKTAEDARRPLAEVAAEGGIGHATREAFNEYSWRPPLPLPSDEDDPTPPAERWTLDVARINAVMGKYHTLRETPVGAFAPIMDDVGGTGAFYLVQVDERTEPPFEEMTEAQKTASIRAVRVDRFGRVARELEYTGLKDRLGLRINGEPAPEMERPAGR